MPRGNRSKTAHRSGLAVALSSRLILGALGILNFSAVAWSQCTVAASDAEEPVRLFMPDGQLISSPIRVFLNRDIPGFDPNKKDESPKIGFLGGQPDHGENAEHDGVCCQARWVRLSFLRFGRASAQSADAMASDMDWERGRVKAVSREAGARQREP
jgi:hypothetical protein